MFLDARRRLSGLLLVMAMACALAGFALACGPLQAFALQPTGVDNTHASSLRSTSELVATGSGYMRVYYDRDKSTVGIEEYDNSFNIKSKKSIAMELPLWGGFYAGTDGCYYLVEGQTNTAENNAATVVRVIKYDKSWNRKGAANITSNPSLFGGEVRYPFDYGSCEMTDYNGKLYIVTGHQGYVDEAVGQGHQGYLMICVNTASMTGSIVDCDLWHSFAQYIANKGANLFVLEQSEGGRYTQLSKCDASGMRQTSASVLDYGGSRTSAWAIACYASVDGIALSSSNVLGIGTSIDQAHYDEAYSAGLPHNIYLTVTPQSNVTQAGTAVKWLTSYTSKGKAFYGVKLTKINDNRFMVSWEEFEASQKISGDDVLSTGILHYLFVDGSGNKLTREFTAGATISDCQPIVKGSNVVFYTATPNTIDFYTINASTGAFSKKVHRVLGDNATWAVSSGVLTVSGTGKIAASASSSSRSPLSSTQGMFSYSSSGPWGILGDSVKKVVVKTGITEIGDGTFSGLGELTTAVVEPGIKKLGKEVFARCGSIREVHLPSSVTSIGEDMTWSGSYWVSDNSHVLRGEICAPSGSYALTYAKKNGMGYLIDISNISLGGINSQYNYTGKAVKPAPVVKVGGKTLKQGVDYTVTWKNNVKKGTATVTVTGTEYYLGYIGTVSKTFKIIDKNAIVITAKNLTKTYAKKAQTFSLGAKATGNAKLTYKSNSKAVTVNSKGKVTVKAKFIGKATITVTGKNAAGKKAVKKVTVTVTPTKTTLVSAKSAKGQKATVKWKKNTTGAGYQVRYSTDKSFKKGVVTKKISKSSTTSLTLSKLKKGATYYVQVRVIKKVGSTTIASAWSPAKRIVANK